jgi:HEAT repeat protein
MTPRKYLAILLASVFALSLAVRASAQELLDGKPLEEWVKLLQEASKHEERADAAVALYNRGPDPKLVPVWSKALRDKHDYVRTTAAGALGRIGKPALAPLQEGLADSDPKVREAAADGLGVMGETAEPATGALARAVLDGDARVRLSAARAWWKINRSPYAVSVLVATLKDPDENLRRAASFALGPVGKPAVASILPLLKEKDLASRLAAAHALFQMGPEAAAAAPALIENRQGILPMASLALVSVGRASVPALLTALQQKGDDALRVFVLATLENLGPEAKEAVPALTELLRDAEPALRRATATALGSMGPEAKAAVPALSEALTKADRLSRLPLALSLWRVDYQTDKPLAALRQAFQDRDPVYRAEVVRYLLQLDTAAIHTLTQALADPSEEVRDAAVVALAQIGPPAMTAAPALLALLRDFKTDARAAVVEALGRIQDKRPETLTVLRAALKDARTRRAALGALTNLGPAAAPAVPDLVTALNDVDFAGMQPLLIAALGRIGPAAKEAVPALLRLLKDEASRDLALPALRQIDRNNPAFVKLLEDEVIPALAATLQDPRAKDQSRRLAARVLGELGRPAIPALVRALESKDALTREAALDALAEMKEEAKDAVPALQKALADDSMGVRVAAAQALWQTTRKKNGLLPVLLAGLQDGQREVRNRSAFGLGQLSPDSADAVELLTAALDDEAVRWEAARALGLIGPKAKSAVPALRKLLTHSDGNFRAQVALALWRIDREQEVLPTLVQLVRNTSELGGRYQAIEALGNIGPDARPTVPYLLHILYFERQREGAQSPEVAAWALKKIDPDLASRAGLH